MPSSLQFDRWRSSPLGVLLGEDALPISLLILHGFEQRRCTLLSAIVVKIVPGQRRTPNTELCTARSVRLLVVESEKQHQRSCDEHKDTEKLQCQIDPPQRSSGPLGWHEIFIVGHQLALFYRGRSFADAEQACIIPFREV